MKRWSDRQRRLFILLAGVVLIGGSVMGVWIGQERAAARRNAPGRFPVEALQNVADYTFMWWTYGWRGRSPEGHRVFSVQTSRYGLVFDVDAATLTHLGPIAAPRPESEAVAQENEVVLGLPPAALEYRLQIEGRTYRSVAFELPMDNARIIESGKFMQRMELLKLVFEDEQGQNPPGLEGRLELVCWPDRAALILHLKPQTTLNVASLETRLALDPALRNVTLVGGALLQSGGYDTPAALCLTGEGRKAGGLVLLNPQPETASTWRVDAPSGGTQVVVRRDFEPPWPAEVEQSFPLALMPVSKDALTVGRAAVAQEAQPLTGAQLSAEGLAPYTGPLAVRFDRLRGWYEVALGHHDQSWDLAQDLDRIERVRLVLTNPDDTPRTVRLNLAKDYNFAGITGMSPMIRDADGYPTGLPVQISKDWHGWVWFHGLTMLTLPPKTSLPLEFTMAYARWGGVPAASHAQLCLVGWGTNQLWDQSAIGSFGESICYDPDVNLGRAMIDDVRPLMVWGMTQQRDAKVKWNWTNNVGGGDFLVYFDAGNKRQYLSRMRTSYRRYAPCLTEVTYAGITPDGHIAARITVSTARTDDVVRGLYRLRYDVLEETPFRRLAFFQLGADAYNDHQFKRMARGDVIGVQEEWAPVLDQFGYEREGIACTGEQPWFSLHEADSSRAQGGAWANRGLIIRRWQARLGGQDAPVPYAGVFVTYDRFKSANVELNPPPGVTTLQKGDYVEAEVELVVLPMFAEDYYGPNEALRQALAEYPNSWQAVWREAAGNALALDVQQGRLERRYPIRVQVGRGDRAAFSVTGGVGYVPLTFAGLRDYRGWVLERDDGAGWQPVDQTVHGRDFWQTDYDPLAGRWELTYNVPLDGAPGQTVHFRLRRE